MIEPLSALRTAARELLAAAGERRLAGLVDRAELELVGAGERWSMGSREVTAARLALAVDPASYVALTADPAQLAAVREAFARAVRSPETELAELALVVKLPGVERGWHHAYRAAAPRTAPERPEPDAVLGGAAALLEASGDAAGAAALRRADLEAADVPGAGFPALIRYVLRLDPADRAAADRDAALCERLRRAVREAATRAAEAVAGVELATAHRPREAAGDAAEARLTLAFEALGAVVVPVLRGADRTELAVIAGGEIRRVELVSDARPADLRWRSEAMPAITVARSRLADPAEASAVAALVFGAMSGE